MHQIDSKTLNIIKRSCKGKKPGRSHKLNGGGPDEIRPVEYV